VGNFGAGGGGQLSANYANCLMLLPEQIVAACCKFLNVLLAMWEWLKSGGHGNSYRRTTEAHDISLANCLI